MQIKECKHCGKQFETYKLNQIYCSKDCQRKGWAKKNTEKIRARSKGCASTKGKNLLDWCNENGEYGQKLLAEYSSKNKLTPEKMSAGSHKIANWICSTCGYEWEAIVELQMVMVVHHVPDISLKQIIYTYGAWRMENEDKGYYQNTALKMS